MSKPSVKEITDPKLACRQKFKLNKNKQTKNYAMSGLGQCKVTSLSNALQFGVPVFCRVIDSKCCLL